MNYLEILEELTEQEAEERLPQMIRLEVADEDEARAEYKTRKAEVNFPHTAKMHGHEHKADKSKNTPCVLCDLKQPKKNDIIEE
jgi:hypothetical protein